jgi:threonine dehydrogenase-like Zn-dependent dehydrogenase
MLAFRIAHAGDTTGGAVQVPTPAPDGPGFCLIQVSRAGVCNTDLEILQGYMGFTGVLGHEFVGVVVAVHEGTPAAEAAAWIGQRVCGDINVGCATCAVCCDTTSNRRCRPNLSRNHCPHRTVMGILKRPGCMAEYLTLPLRNLHRVPDHVSDETAVFSEPLAAACRIVEQGLICYPTESSNAANDESAHDNVAILGDGKLGLMIAEVLGRAHLQHYGRDKSSSSDAPILFGKHAHKLALVSESGVVGKLVKECQDDTARNGVAAAYAGRFDVVVDATGSPAGLTLAAGLTKPMGTLVLKSTCAAGERFNAAPFVIDELRVVGSRCGPLDEALRLLALPTDVDGDALPPLRVEKYVTKTFPLAQAAEAMLCAAEKGTMKVQIICHSEA